MRYFDPFREFEQLRREVDRAFQSLGVTGPAKAGRGLFLPGRSARAYPLVNVVETEAALKVEALAPGVNPETFDVTVHGNTLTLSGEKPANGTAPESYHRSERAAGKFTRTFELPIEVDEEKVQAEYKHGILTITLPKAAAAQPKRISVAAD